MIIDNKIVTLDGIPLYIQIRESIFQRIKNQDYKAGDQISTEEDLAREFGVSRMTIRHAISQLVQEGILERRQGIGTFVISHQITRHYTYLSSFYEEALQQGLNPSSKLLSIQNKKANRQIADLLNIELNEGVYLIKRLRLLNDEPIAINIVWMPSRYFPLPTNSDVEGSLYAFYEEYGKSVVLAKQRIEARLATQKQAELLRIQKNSPILYSDRVTYTYDNIPIERVEAFAAGTSYSIEMILYRDKQQAI